MRRERFVRLCLCVALAMAIASDSAVTFGITFDDRSKKKPFLTYNHSKTHSQFFLQVGTVLRNLAAALGPIL